jgi:hypothetical protein
MGSACLAREHSLTRKNKSARIKNISNIRGDEIALTGLITKLYRP